MQAAAIAPLPGRPEPLAASQRVTQVSLLLVALIAVLGGTLQMVLGQPETTQRLDNVHRFLAGIYLSVGFVNLWAALTIRRQTELPFLLALGVLIAGTGRLVSMSIVGLPQPAALWLGYLVPELGLPFVIAGSHWITWRRARLAAGR